MSTTTYQDEGYASFQEETLGVLGNEQFFAVCLAAGANQIKIPTTEAEAENSIGVIFQRYDENSPDIQVALFNKEGSLKGRAAAVLPKGSLVKPGAGGTFVLAASKAEAFGRYIGDSASAVGDVIEILTL